MRTAAVAALLLLAASPAKTMECRPSRVHDHRYWSWRLIDGRPCWYAGRPGISKAVLHWGSSRAQVKRADPKDDPDVLPRVDKGWLPQE